MVYDHEDHPELNRHRELVHMNYQGPGEGRLLEREPSFARNHLERSRLVQDRTPMNWVLVLSFPICLCPQILSCSLEGRHLCLFVLEEVDSRPAPTCLKVFLEPPLQNSYLSEVAALVRYLCTFALGDRYTRTHHDRVPQVV